MNTHPNRPNDRLLGGETTPVMPTKVGIHDFDAAGKQVMDGGPSPAMTRGKALQGSIFRAAGVRRCCPDGLGNAQH